MQLAIDGCKKIFDIDVNDEIKRIRAQECMNREKDFPKFMAYTHKIPVTKNGKDRPYEDIQKDKKRVQERIDETIECPMNWMHDCLDKIQGAEHESNIDTLEFLIDKPTKRVDPRQMNKVRDIIEKYDSLVRHYIATNNNEDDGIDEIDQLQKATDEVVEAVSKIKMSQATMFRLIQTCLGYEGRVNKNKSYKNATKYAIRTMNILYKSNPERFLSCFKKG